MDSPATPDAPPPAVPPPLPTARTGPPDPKRPRIRSLPPPVRLRGALPMPESVEVALSDDMRQLHRHARDGANWFYWVAGLSLINSVVSLSGGGISFLAGLAVSQFVDGFARELGQFGLYFNLGLDLIITFFVCGFGYLASHGSRAAFIAGMILYGLDGLIFVLFAAWMPALFHVWVLVFMGRGLIALRDLAAVERNIPQKTDSLEY